MKQNSVWTETQLVDLKNLVDAKGRKWADIAKDVYHTAEQCRAKFRSEFEQTYGGIRKKSGKFDQAEDDQLEVEVRAIKSDHTNSPENIDVKGISWKEVANKMDNMRTSADYARRWQRLLITFSGGDRGRRGKGSHSKNEAVDDDNHKLIDALDKLVHPDSERGDVVWVGLERTLEFPYGAAARRFNLLVSKFGVSDSCFYDQVREIANQLNNGASGVGSGLAKPRQKRKVEPTHEVSSAPLVELTTTIEASVPVADTNIVTGTVAEDTDDDLINLPKPKKSKKHKNKHKHKSGIDVV
jgi:hypothetical protein